MQNLNDYYFFVQVVKYKGFTKASENLGVTKSKLSRRISDLETRLGVRLIQRNTRKFAVTDIGQQFYEYCLKILNDVENAENFIQSTVNNEPSGLIKISCPVALVQMPVSDFITQFMQKYRDVQVHLLATNRRVDLIEEGVDLAIRVRNTPLEDSDLIMRELDAWEHVFVAIPELFKQYKSPETLDDLSSLPSIGFQGPKQVWQLQKKNEENIFHEIEFHPRLKTDNFSAMKAGVMRGIGIASLPKVYVREELKNGKLIEVLPDWHLPRGVIYIAYTSRLGMLPAVRSLLEYLVEQFKQLDINDGQTPYPCPE
ncbi:LysR substrate-binding domain-containing protein [Acinetobacter stercoris]|uniref:HTH-type transcriptional regulator DmlR n=1 Tax=Acinetobacter stercoris TaxID=2126983 RepID=A0A2U3MYS9_9GAMM|nr:LysR substrate-binding domain-containing protein [Acinetobacter stercoris]SPL70580.1 HTH-type transcriptional regulator DmlR [Acinetobacter stercoris]